MKRFSDFLWLWVLLAVPVALKLPSLFLPLKPLIKPLLASVILAMGLTLKGRELLSIFKKPKLLIVGLFTQYSAMPLLGLVFGLIFLKNINPELVAGQVLTGSCPTGVVSNVYNFLTGANVALSIALSGVNTLVSPLLTPVLTKVLVGKLVAVNGLKLFLDMVQITLIPVLVGIGLNSIMPEKIEKVKPYLPAYSTFAVVLIVGFVVAAGSSKILSLPPKAFLYLFLASLFHLLFGFWLGYLIPRFSGLEPKERITISIETAMQNSGLATVLAVSQWGALAALPAVFYSVVQNLVGPFVIKLFRLIHGKHLNAR
ncbi:bile acid:sodium symporter family protein [Thermovibrio sp.]